MKRKTHNERNAGTQVGIGGTYRQIVLKGQKEETSKDRKGKRER